MQLIGIAVLGCSRKEPGVGWLAAMSLGGIVNKTTIPYLIFAFALLFTVCCSDRKNNDQKKSSLEKTFDISTLEHTKNSDDHGNDYFISDSSNAFYLQNEKNIIFSPHTVTSDNQKVFKINDKYYFNFINTLCVLDENNRIEIFRLPPGKEYYSNRISSIELIDDTLWISTRNNGIWLFDISKNIFSKQIAIYNPEKRELNGNLFMKYDYNKKILWVSSFMRLDMYSRKSNKWTNLNSKSFELGIGKQAGPYKILIDENDVWFEERSWRESTGGILHYNYEKNEWRAYIKELDGMSKNEFNRYDLQDIVSSTDYLWVTTSFGENTAANIRLVLLNKNTRKWSYYHPNDFQNLAPIIKETENCQRIIILNSLLSSLNKYKNMYYYIKKGEDYYHYYEKYLSATDTNKINYSINVLSNIPVNKKTNSLCINNHMNYITKNNKIFYCNDRKELDSLAYLKLPLHYNKVLAEYENNLIVGTNHGIVIINISDKKIAKYLGLPSKDYDYENMTGVCINNNKIYLLDNSEISDDDYVADNAKIYLYEIDMNRYSVSVSNFPYQIGNQLVDSLKMNLNSIITSDISKYSIDQEGLKIKVK